jgi:hypothetical protein
MLLNGDMVLSYLQMYRICWIGGRFGGGKTALAFRLAYELVASGRFRYLISNVDSVWRDDLAAVKPRYEGNRMFADCVVVLDEGGLFLKTGTDAEKYLAFLRKFNICIIIPSVQPPASRVKFMSVQMIFNGYSLGLPFWMYKLVLSYMASKEVDYFTWLNPTEVFGVYDTGGVPTDDAGIGDWLVDFTNEAQQRAGYVPKVASYPFVDAPTSAAAAASRQAERVVEDLDEVFAGLQDLSVSLKKQARRR